MTRTSRLAVLVLGLAVGGTLSAQAPPRLTVDAIYHPERRVDFSGLPAPETVWIDDATFLTTRRVARGVEWNKVTADSGASTPLFDPTQMEMALAALPGISRDEAGSLARSRDLTFNAALTGALLTIADDLYYYEFSGRRAVRLTE